MAKHSYLDNFQIIITRQTSAWKNLNLSGHNQETKGLPINLDKKKHEDAPAVALKTTNIIPRTTPKKSPIQQGHEDCSWNHKSMHEEQANVLKSILMYVCIVCTLTHSHY